MFKLMKYEFRKMRATLMLMGLALIALEAAFIVCDHLEEPEYAGLALGLLSLLAIAVYGYILIAGIVSYSRELNDRTGYLTFMTPVSAMGIVASRLLFTILAAVIVTALFGATAYVDYAMLFRRANFGRVTLEQADQAFRMIVGPDGADLMQVVLAVAYRAGSVILQILLVMCSAFLAITLSATLLNNKKSAIRGVVSFAFFLLLQALTSQAGVWVSESQVLENTDQLLRLLSLTALMDALFCVAFALASAWLLDRRVSL